MRYYEVTSIKRSGATGRRLGVVKAPSKSKAVKFLARRKKLPTKVRVFPAKLVKASKRKSVSVWKPRWGI